MTPRCLLLAGLVALPASVMAQGHDSLSLSALQASARRHDPRASEADLLAAQSRLRRRSLDAEQLPALAVDGQAQYQSEVAHLAVALPGLSLPTPRRDTYDARASATQRLIDPSRAPRNALETAQLGESQARLRVTLQNTRQAVNDAFFATLRAETLMGELEPTIADLESQARAAQTRVREGTALPSEARMLEAELLRRRQAMAELQSSRHAALATLQDLTGVSLQNAGLLTVPDLSREVTRARTGLDSLRARAEYEQFAASRETLQRQEDVRAAQDKPRVSVFGRLGYGRPGLNPLGDRFNTYWLGGIQLQWTPLTWGATSDDREVLAVQRQIVSAEEQSFTEALRRSVNADLAAIDRLSATLTMDDEIVALREGIVAETRHRYAEQVVTVAEFIDRETDLLTARAARASHRVELAQSQARFLTTMGIEVR